MGDIPIPAKMHKYDYEEFLSTDWFCINAFFYFVICNCLFLYPILGKLFLYRTYEYIFELFIRGFDIFGLEIHFIRYIYYGIISDSHEIMESSDFLLLLFISLPFIICIAEFLTVPSHVRELEYEGRIIIFFTPSLILVFFLYQSTNVICFAVLHCVYVFCILWYIAEVSDKQSEKDLMKKYGEKYHKMKAERDSSILQQVALGFGAYPGISTYK